MRGPIFTNLTVRVGGAGALAIATLLVARAGGPAAVGNFALLRVLPWLFGVVLSAGLPTAAPYFLTGEAGEDRRVRSTVAAIMVGAGVVGTVLWLLLSPLIAKLFLRDLPLPLVQLAGITVLSQLIIVIAKAAGQALDVKAGNWAILLDDMLFLPAFAALWLAHVEPNLAVVVGLLLADILGSAVVWGGLCRRGFFRGCRPPSLAMGCRILWFGGRSQLANMIGLLNLRLDFLLVGALAGPAILGTYAVASKFAEVLRLLPTTLNWVLYPKYAQDGRPRAAAGTRRMLPAAVLCTLTVAAPLALAAPLLLPGIYGEAFRPAVLPAEILLLGLLGDGVANVISAFLLASGRPGLNSLAMAPGLVLTVALDAALIPRYQALGAACASALAYLVTACVLMTMFHRLASEGSRRLIVNGVASVAPGLARRALDMMVASLALALLWPFLLLLSVAARMSTGASPLFRQQRVGQGGVAFTLYKFRTMRPVDGPQVTVPRDPRITPVGRFLRATSLDELPQLLNVLRGDMTLVGPRPEAAELAERYPAEYRFIFAFRPGLTGPVQVHLRDESPPVFEDAESYYLTYLLPRRVAADWDYVVKPSVALTLALLAETALHVLRRPITHATSAVFGWRPRSRESKLNPGAGDPA